MQRAGVFQTSKMQRQVKEKIQTLKRNMTKKLIGGTECISQIAAIFKQREKPRFAFYEKDKIHYHVPFIYETTVSCPLMSKRMPNIFTS